MVSVTLRLCYLREGFAGTHNTDAIIASGTDNSHAHLFVAFLTSLNDAVLLAKAELKCKGDRDW